MKNLEVLCLQGLEVVQSVGDFIRQEVGRVEASAIESKGLNDLVSYVDKEAERRLVGGLGRLFPEATFITEEATVKNEKGKFSWVIDPLDGTTNFLHQIPHFSISVALLEQNEPIIGIVFEVNLKEAFYAWRGGGAFRNGLPMRVSTAERLLDSVIGLGFPYRQFADFDRAAGVYLGLIRQTRGVRRMGSAALDLAYVACGRFDGFFEVNLNPWDVAAGICLVREAGGVVQDFSGGNDVLFGRQMVASNLNLSKLFLAAVRQLYGLKP